MGYVLNELANLPVDENVHFYIFVINGQVEEPFYRLIQDNFVRVARSIGNNAVIAIGSEPQSFTTSIARKYLGAGNSDNSFVKALPAMLITNAHPDRLTKASLRLVVPLRDAEQRFGGWTQFFVLLAAYVRGESDKFLTRFEAQTDLLDAANRIVQLKPNMFGLGLNINELIDRWRKRAPKPKPSG